DAGVAVLYISHHLEEVFEICQDVAVLRDGKLVLTAPVAGLTKDGLVSSMVGAAVVSAGLADPADSAGCAGRREHAGTVVTVEKLTANSPRGRLSGVSLQVGTGEIVGVTGLLSAGVATLGRAIAGAEPHDGGRITLAGQVITAGRRDVAQQAGI